MDKNLPAFTFMDFLKYLCVLFFSVLFSFSFAQVKFSASIDNRTIGKNDYLQVQFNLENAANVETITPPSFKNFSVISGPNQQSSISNINGNVKQIISISFVLQPLAPGTYTIGSAIAKADGKEYHSNPLNIKVTKSVTTGNAGNNSSLSPFGNITLDYGPQPVTHQFDDYILKKGENVAEKIKKNLFVKIEVSKTTCYVGESLTATYKLYTRLKSESNVVKAPSFNGFSVNELESQDNLQLRTEMYNGRQYNVYTLRKVQLYPLQPGVLSLEPVEVNNRITFLKAEYAGKRDGDFFYDLLRDFANENAPGNTTEQQNVTVTGDTVNVQAKPLPDANKPASFKGAVGNFKIDAALEKTNFTTDDAGALKVIISGAGNIQLINAPTVLWPQGIEGFESRSSENLDKFSVPLKGDKIFIYPFTISNSGNYTIPAINFSYFDINAQSYKTVSSKPLAMRVIKGSGNSQKIFTENKNPPFNTNWFDSIDVNLFYFIAALLLFCVLLFFFIKNKRAKKDVVTAENQSEKDTYVKPPKSFRNYQPDPVEEEAFILPLNPLADAQEKLLGSDSQTFYKVLDVSLYKYLAEKLKVPVGELTKKKINERMDKCSVGVGTTLLVNSLLEEIQLSLYAQIYSETKMQEVYDKANEVVSLLDKQIVD